MNNQIFEFLKLFDDREKEYCAGDLCINLSENNQVGIIYKTNTNYRSIENNELTEFLFNVVFNRFSQNEKENFCIFAHSFMGFQFDINKCKFNANFSYVVICKKRPTNFYDIIDSHISSLEKDELLHILSKNMDNKSNKRI